MKKKLQRKIQRYIEHFAQHCVSNFEKKYNVCFSKENINYQNCQVKREKTITGTKKYVHQLTSRHLTSAQNDP